MNKLSQIIAQNGFALADGATGTNLFAKGLVTGDAPELWNLQAADKIRELHDDFLKAGSDIILTNSFGGTHFRLALHNAQDKVAELNYQAAQIAVASAKEAGKDVVVAGSMGPTGELFTPLGALDEPHAIAAFTEQATALAEGGVDLLWIETMS